MIIISQTGRRYNFDNIIAYDSVLILDKNGGEEQGEVVCKMVNNETASLGVYDTMQRAEEVVEEIDKAYLATRALLGNQTPDKVTAISLMKKIYKMPDE